MHFFQATYRRTCGHEWWGRLFPPYYSNVVLSHIKKVSWIAVFLDLDWYNAGPLTCIIVNFHSRRAPIMTQTYLHCQCILSILPASVHQFYANIFVFVNINPFLYINDQFALIFTCRHDDKKGTSFVKNTLFFSKCNFDAILAI